MRRSQGEPGPGALEGESRLGGTRMIRDKDADRASAADRMKSDHTAALVRGDEHHGIACAHTLGEQDAGIFAYLSVAFLTRYFRMHEVKMLRPFAIYCVVIGIGAIAIMLSRAPAG